MAVEEKAEEAEGLKAKMTGTSKEGKGGAQQTQPPDRGGEEARLGQDTSVRSIPALPAPCPMATEEWGGVVLSSVGNGWGGKEAEEARQEEGRKQRTEQ